MLKTKSFAALAGAVALLAATGAHAGPAWEFTTPGQSYTDGTWDFVTAFTANSAATVSGLGYYADPITGNADGNPVALYQCADVACDTTGTLIASATVTNTYALTGHFRYVTINPITLTAGVSYEVAGVSNSDNYTWGDTGFTTDPSITILSDGNGDTDRWLQIGTPDFLTGFRGDINGQDGFWGPDVFLGDPTFTQVPEPASMTLFGSALALLALARRRKCA